MQVPLMQLYMPPPPYWPKDARRKRRVSSHALKWQTCPAAQRRESSKPTIQNRGQASGKARVSKRVKCDVPKDRTGLRVRWPTLAPPHQGVASLPAEHPAAMWHTECRPRAGRRKQSVCGRILCRTGGMFQQQFLVSPELQNQGQPPTLLLLSVSLDKNAPP
jgi:hypothetical protein